MPLTNLAFANGRREDRDDVHYRTVARGSDGRPVPMLVVNISPNGLMARCDAAVVAEELLAITLPDLPHARATVRWALGGRIGCEFDQPLSPRAHLAMLPRLRG